MDKITWLASYPKSGNTWVRLFLSALISGEAHSFESPALNRIFNESDIFFKHLDHDPFLFTQSEIDLYYPRIWEAEHQSLQCPVVKIHETFRRNTSGEYICPLSVSKNAIYIIRNPLDVCISLSHFIGMPIDETITLMNAAGTASKGRFFESRALLSTHIGSWQENVTSWTDQTELPCLIVRYEDMIAQEQQEFERIVNFLKWPHTPEQIATARQEVQFSKLRKNERRSGFSKPPVANAFFRNGKKDQWKHVLTQIQINRLLTANEQLVNHYYPSL